MFELSHTFVCMSSSPNNTLKIRFPIELNYDIKKFQFHLFPQKEKYHQIGVFCLIPKIFVFFITTYRIRSSSPQKLIGHRGQGVLQFFGGLNIISYHWVRSRVESVQPIPRNNLPLTQKADFGCKYYTFFYRFVVRYHSVFNVRTQRIHFQALSRKMKFSFVSDSFSFQSSLFQLNNFGIGPFLLVSSFCLSLFRQQKLLVIMLFSTKELSNASSSDCQESGRKLF